MSRREARDYGRWLERVGSRTEAAPARRSWPLGYYVNASTLEPWWAGAWGLSSSEANALGLSSVWRCVTVIADAIAGRAWSEWRGDVELEPSRIVRRPAARYTRRSWTWRVVAALALYNRAPLWMVGGVDNEGVPGSLLPVPPDAVQPVEPIDELGLVLPTRYTIGQETVSAEELLILERAPLPSIAPHHAALLQLARRVFRQAIAADIGASRYWETGGSPTTVLTSDQELTRTQADAIEERWLEKRAAGNVAVLGKGAHAEPYGADPTTESAVEARRELVADVARLFGLPTRLVNAPTGDSRTYANTESDSLDLIRYTLEGYSGPIVDGISDLLPGDPILGRRIEINLDELTRPSMADRYGAYSVALAGAPFMTPDEVRSRERMGPMPAPVPPPAPAGPPEVRSAPVDGPGEAERAEVDADTTTEASEALEGRESEDTADATA